MAKLKVDHLAKSSGQPRPKHTALENEAFKNKLAPFFKDASFEFIFCYFHLQCFQRFQEKELLSVFYLN
jgi:hypothetical protein